MQVLSTIQTETTTSRPQKQINRWPGSSRQDTPSSSSSIRRSVASRSTGQVAKPCSQYLGSGPSRYGVKNLSCSSISDVLPSGCSSSNLSNSRKVTSVRKRPSDGESSSSGGKSTSGSSISSLSDSSGSQMPQQAIRRAKIRPTSRDAPVSVRTRRAPVGESRKKLPEQQNNNSVSISEPIIYPQRSRSQLSILEPVPESSSRSCPMEAPPVGHNSFDGRPSSSGRSARGRPMSSHPANSSRHGPLGDRDGYRRFNMDGIAEVLLALERIEQNDELTYEQLMMLETNLFLGVSASMINIET
ncbi:E3 ubiquitin-protein ligase MBR2-like [Iris pallida]|uniref:E3 ubiquitin-protein ligase MBR2-like n=1 Tax=Iris pallida TaxID=29817 RepID=A0AAX6EW00_IRIPA|nr:E3 ubiquitin-protein ligase MBR2-like [Iris pallida]